MADRTPEGSPTAASSTMTAPLDIAALSARATSTARRVLPTPPGPTSVIKRWSANNAVSSRSSCSRPTSGVNGVGRFE